MYRFRSIKYLTTTGLITALLLVIAYVSALFGSLFFTSMFGGSTTLQLFDVVFIPFCAIFKGPMLLFAGTIAGALFDLLSGVKIVSVPMTIIIRILMFFVIKMLVNEKWWTAIYGFLCAAVILIIGYPSYYWLIYNNQSLVINELITDAIQGGIAYVLALPIYYCLYQIQLKSNHSFWNDRHFDYLKPTKQKNVKIDNF